MLFKVTNCSNRKIITCGLSFISLDSNQGGILNYKRLGEAARVHHWDARTSQPHKNSANSKLARITSM